jgi:hypothetical protein
LKSNKRKAGHQNRRQAAIKRRRKRRLRKYTLYYLLLIIVGVAAGVAMSLTVFFKINTVTVEGGTRYADGDLIAVSCIERGTNLFMADTESARLAILSAYPYIEDVRVRRAFPDGIVIEVTEAQPYAALRSASGYMLITEEGRILDTELTELPAGFVQVIGMEPGYLRPGAYLPESCGEQLVMLRYLQEALGEVPFGGLDLIDLSDRLNIRMLYERRIILSLGSESDLERKLRHARVILETKTGENFQGILNAAETLPTLRYRDIFSPDVWPFGETLRQLYLPVDRRQDSLAPSQEQNDADDMADMMTDQSADSDA